MANLYVNYATGNDSTGDGSSVNPYKTMGKASSLAVAGDIVYGTGTEVLAAVITFANPGSVASGYIRYIACNSSWVPTVGAWIIDGNSARANLLDMAGKHYLSFEGIDFKNATAYNITLSTNTYTYFNRFIDCLIHNAGTVGIGHAGGYINGTILLRCKIYSNGTYGINGINNIRVIDSEVYSNGSYGFNQLTNSNNGVNSFINSIFRGNTTIGLAIKNGDIIKGCVVDGTATGIYLAYLYVVNLYVAPITEITDCVISNCSTYGIRVSSAGYFLLEEKNVFYNNGTNRSSVANSAIFSIGNSVDSSSDPYINSSVFNFNRKPGTEIRFLDLLMPGGVVHQAITAGLPVVPDFPTAANTLNSDTVDTIPGTATVPDAGKVAQGSGTYGAGGTAITPTRTDCPAAKATAAASYGDPASQTTGAIPLSDVMPASGGTSDKLYSSAEEAARNDLVPANKVIREADGGPASYKHLNTPVTPTFNLSAAQSTAFNSGVVAGEANNDFTGDENDIITGETLKLHGSLIHGNAIREIHSADQVVHSAGGNVIDETIIPINIRKDVVAGLGVVGTLQSGGSLPAPSAPILSAVPASAHSIDLSWTPAAFGEKYALYRKAPGGVFARIPDASTYFTSAEYRDSGLTPKTVYVYRVDAMNDSGNTDSNEAATTTPAVATVPAPIQVPFSFYTVVTADNGVEVKDLAYADVYGELQVIKNNPVDAETFNQTIKGYLFIPDKYLSAIGDGMQLVDKNGSTLKIECVEAFDDHQEITLRKVND